SAGTHVAHMIAASRSRLWLIGHCLLPSMQRPGTVGDSADAAKACPVTTGHCRIVAQLVGVDESPQTQCEPKHPRADQAHCFVVGNPGVRLSKIHPKIRSTNRINSCSGGNPRRRAVAVEPALSPSDCFCAAAKRTSRRLTTPT